MPRDRQETRSRILNATERVLTRAGFHTVGINTIAAEAAVDKVLIYRYFGGLPELLSELSRERRLWPPLDAPITQATSLDQAVSATLTTLRHELRDRPLLRQTLAWEFVNQNPLTSELATLRERELNRMTDLLRTHFTSPRYLDLDALLAILIAAISYLAVHRQPDNGTQLLGLDLDDDHTWLRIDRTLRAIIRTVLGEL